MHHDLMWFSQSQFLVCNAIYREGLHLLGLGINELYKETLTGAVWIQAQS